MTYRMIASTRFVLFRGAKRVLASFELIASTRTAERFLMHFCEFYQKNSQKCSRNDNHVEEIILTPAFNMI